MHAHYSILNLTYTLVQCVDDASACLCVNGNVSIGSDNILQAAAILRHVGAQHGKTQEIWAVFHLYLYN